ncbi:MAG: hypothetical protein Q7S98_05370, partial [Deltaproteobacteria bacterium]|nr:hypothetical protein [Deltaproteobacteria bacterium]
MAPNVHTIPRNMLLRAMAQAMMEPDPPALEALVDELAQITGSGDGVVIYNGNHEFEIVREDGYHERVKREFLYQALVEKYFGGSGLDERGRIYETLLSMMPGDDPLGSRQLGEGGLACYDGAEPFTFPHDLLSVKAVLMTISPGGFPWGHYPTPGEFPGHWLVDISEEGDVTTLGFDGGDRSWFIEFTTDSMRIVTKGDRLFLVATNAQTGDQWELPLPVEQPGSQLLLRNDSASRGALLMLLQVAVGANTGFLQSSRGGIKYSLDPQDLLVRTHSFSKFVGLFPLEDPTEPPFLGMVEFDPTGNHRFHVAYRDSFRLRQRGSVWEIEYETLTPLEGFNLVRSLALHPDHASIREWIDGVTAGGSQVASYPVSVEHLEALLVRQPLSGAESREEDQVKREAGRMVAERLESVDYSLRRVLIELLYESDPDAENDDDDDDSSGGGTAGGATGGPAGGMTTKGRGPGHGPFRAADEIDYRGSNRTVHDEDGSGLLGVYPGETVFE